MYMYVYEESKKNSFVHSKSLSGDFISNRVGLCLNLTLCMLGNNNFACFFFVCGFFFFKLTFSKKNFRNTIRVTECQTFWIQIRPDFLMGLIWVQTVCKDYKQMTKVDSSGEIVNIYHSDLWANSAGNILKYFFLYFPEIGPDISCK